MPNPNKHPRVVAAYRNILRLTGLNLAELEPEEIRNVLRKFYVDGKSLYNSRNMDQQREVDNNVVALNSALTHAFDTDSTERSVISIIEPDDPFAMPRMVMPEKPLDYSGEPIENPDASAMKNFANKKTKAENFEKAFRKNHRKNLEKTGKELPGYRMPAELKAEDYFDVRAMKKQNSLKSLREKETAVGLCNLILLGRGYTTKDLSGTEEDVREAKRKAGAEVAALFDDSLSPEERSRRLGGLVNTAIDSLNQLSLRPVDLSDESTLNNIKYNQWIASMADSLGKVTQEAQQTLAGDWIAKAASDVKKITNFTNGIIGIDNLRLRGLTGGFRNPEDMRESVLAQVFVEKVGPSYAAYRTGRIGAAANDMNLLEELHQMVQNGQGKKPEYRNAYQDYRSKGNIAAFKQLLEQDFAKENNTLAEKVRENIRSAEQKRTARTEKDEVFAWADGIPGMTADGLCSEMRELFSGSGSPQAGRKYTMQSLLIGFGCYMAEQRNEKVEIKDFLTNPELQKKTGREALEFFRQHPISETSSPEEKKESGRHFIQVIAALNRKLADTALPTFDYRNPEKQKEDIEYAGRFKTILCDSHQLSMVVKPLMNEFYEANGGEENYRKFLNQISIGEAMNQAMSDQIPQDVLNKNSLNSIFKDNQAVTAAKGLYVLNNFADKYMGRKISELPQDVRAENLNQVEFASAPELMKFALENNKNPNFKKQIRDYLRTYGEKDAAGFEKKLEQIVAPSLRPEEEEKAEVKEEPKEVKAEQVENAKDEKKEAKSEEKKAGNGEKEVGEEEVVRMEDPGDNVEDLVEKPTERPTIENGSYDWSAEMTPAEWKKRLKKFYEELDSHDPALMKSSDEYRDVKKNLKKALEILNKPTEHRINKKDFNDRMNQVFNRAGDYIAKKDTEGVGKHYGRERLNAMKNIRSLLADRNCDTLDLTGLAAVLGQKSVAFDREKNQEVIVTDGASRQEKLERGMKRLGIYLAIIGDSDPGKVKDKKELLERVIAERGKNSITREKLMDEMAQVKISEYAETSELMEQTKNQIIERVNAQNGLDRQAAGWCKVLKAFDTMCQSSTDPEIHAAADAEVKNYLRLGGFAEKAQQVQNRILDAEEADSLSKEEATAVVAASAISTFMKRTEINFKAKDIWDNRLLFNQFILKKSDSEIMEYFSKSGDTQAIQQEKTNEGLKKHVAGELAQEMIGVRGARKVCAEMAVREKKKQGEKPNQILKNPKKGMNK